MRFLLLTLISAVLIPLGLLLPRYGLLGYVWFGMMRPDALAWAVGTVPYSLLYAVSTLAGSLRYLYQFLRVFQNPFSFIVVLLQIPILLSVLTAVRPELCYVNLDLYLRVIVMSLLVPVLLETEQHLKQLLLVIGGSLGFLGFKFGLFGFRTGGIQYSEGFAGFIGDSNGLALAMAMAAPLCWYGIGMVKHVAFKAGFVILAVGSVATVVLTFSRGNAVALGVALILIALRSRHKMAVLLIVAMLAAPAVLLVYESYLERVSTIASYTEDESAYSRVEFARVALKMARDHPWLGVGFGMENQMALMGAYLGRERQRVLHNTYLQILVDSGVFALLLYLAMLFGAIFWLGLSARRLKKTAPELAVYPRAIQTSLVAFAIGSTFYSRVGFDPLYFLVTATGVWYRVERALSAPQAVAAVGTPAPVRQAPPAAGRPQSVVKAKGAAGDAALRAGGIQPGGQGGAR